MMTEKELIQLILGEMKPDPNHVNDFFTSDSEILDCGDKRFLFTIDNFSKEDHFRTDNPYIFGRNLATCTVSDIFASGGSVLHVGHSITLSRSWDAEYVRMMSRGISDVVTECGGCFAGGDIGTADNWNYTGVAFGNAERILMRNQAAPGDHLYISGPVGSGNFEAAYDLLPMNDRLLRLFEANRVRFPLRWKESQVAAEYASACMDTSDGLLNALAVLAGLNGTGYQVSGIPYFAPGSTLLEALGLPKELLLAGECGEYELLCCVSPEKKAEFLRTAGSQHCQFYPIGRMTVHGIAEIHDSDHTIDMTDFAISAREYNNHEEYLQVLTAYIREKSTSATSKAAI